MSSLRISMDPLEMKYKAESISPLCTKVSPGGTCVVLNFMDNVLRHPGLAPEVTVKVIIDIGKTIM